MPYLKVDVDAIKRAHQAAPIAGLSPQALMGGLNFLWAWAWQEKQTEATRFQLRGLFGGGGPELPEALVAFGFLEELGNDRFRVKGAAEYLMLSEARSRGGKARAGAARDAGQFTSTSPAHHQHITSTPPAHHQLLHPYTHTPIHQEEEGQLPLAPPSPEAGSSLRDARATHGGDGADAQSTRVKLADEEMGSFGDSGQGSPPSPPSVGAPVELSNGEPKQEAPEDRLVARWNATAAPEMPRCRLTPARRKKAKRLLEVAPLESWDTLIAMANGSAFCRGQNDRGWVLSLSKMLETPELALKVLEGNYSGKPATKRLVNDIPMRDSDSPPVAPWCRKPVADAFAGEDFCRLPEGHDAECRYS